jgi:hypothetical protein
MVTNAVLEKTALCGIERRTIRYEMKFSPWDVRFTRLSIIHRPNVGGVRCIHHCLIQVPSGTCCAMIDGNIGKNVDNPRGILLNHTYVGFKPPTKLLLKTSTVLSAELCHYTDDVTTLQAYGFGHSLTMDSVAQYLHRNLYDQTVLKGRGVWC